MGERTLPNKDPPTILGSTSLTGPVADEHRLPDMTTPLALTCSFRHACCPSHQPCFHQTRQCAHHSQVARPRFNAQRLAVGEQVPSTFEPRSQPFATQPLSRHGRVGPCSAVVYSLLPSLSPGMLVRPFWVRRLCLHGSLAGMRRDTSVPGRAADQDAGALHASPSPAMEQVSQLKQGATEVGPRLKYTFLLRLRLAQ
jgi:hypothetical protein